MLMKNLTVLRHFMSTGNHCAVFSLNNLTRRSAIASKSLAGDDFLSYAFSFLCCKCVMRCLYEEILIHQPYAEVPRRDMAHPGVHWP